MGFAGRAAHDRSESGDHERQQDQDRECGAHSQDRVHAGLLDLLIHVIFHVRRDRSEGVSLLSALHHEHDVRVVAGALHGDRHGPFFFGKGTALPHDILHFADIPKRVLPAGKSGSVYRIIHLLLRRPVLYGVIHRKYELARRIIPLLALVFCQFQLRRRF